jgi:hypothetical protein
MKRIMVVGVMVAMTALFACNKEKEGGGSAGSGGSAASGGGGGGGSADAIGIKECDDYIKTWKDCYKDPTARAAAQPGLDQMTKAWKEQAKDANSKAALAQGCKMALDNFPKAACR